LISRRFSHSMYAKGQQEPKEDVHGPEYRITPTSLRADISCSELKNSPWRIASPTSWKSCYIGCLPNGQTPSLDLPVSLDQLQEADSVDIEPSHTSEWSLRAVD
jgi:hypothetical protein